MLFQVSLLLVQCLLPDILLLCCLSVHAKGVVLLLVGKYQRAEIASQGLVSQSCAPTELGDDALDLSCPPTVMIGEGLYFLAKFLGDLILSHLLHLVPLCLLFKCLCELTDLLCHRLESGNLLTCSLAGCAFLALGTWETICASGFISRLLPLQLQVLVLPIARTGILLVDPCLTLDHLGPLRELQGRPSLLHGVHMRVHITDHHGLRVAAKGIFQEVSQLGLAVTDVLGLLGGRRVIQIGGRVVTQVVDDLAEDSQTFVDHASLFDSHTLSSSVLDALTACQINYVESGGFNMLLPGV